MRSYTYKAPFVSFKTTKRLGAIGCLALIFISVVAFFLVSAFWGWLIMLTWALVSTSTVGFWSTGLWLGMIGAVVIAALAPK